MRRASVWREGRDVNSVARSDLEHDPLETLGYAAFGSHAYPPRSRRQRCRSMPGRDRDCASPTRSFAQRVEKRASRSIGVAARIAECGTQFGAKDRGACAQPVAGVARGFGGDCASPKRKVPLGVVRRAPVERGERTRHTIEGVAIGLESHVEPLRAIRDAVVTLHAVGGACAPGSASRGRKQGGRIARQQQRFHGRACMGTIEDNRKLARAIPRARAERRPCDDGPPQR